MERATAVVWTAPRFTLWWTLSIVAAILVLGFLWLALAGSGGAPAGALAHDSPASTQLFMAPGASGRFISQPGLPVFMPSAAGAAAMQGTPAASSDNLAALVLGGAGALAMTTFALLLARKRRPRSASVA